jgi:hypothetical protein
MIAARIGLRPVVSGQWSIAGWQLEVHACGAPQPDHQPKRCREQERRRVESGRRSRESYGSHRASQDRKYGVPHAVQKHDARIKPCERAQSLHSARRYRSQAKQHCASEDKHYQPLSKLERWHGKPAPARAQNGHGWVIYGKKARGSFVKNMQGKSHAQREPRATKT